MAIRDKFYQRIRKVLIKQGVLDEDKAEEAAAIADRENRSFADVLLERDMGDEMGYLSAISLETNIPPVDVEKATVDEDALQIINQELATYYCVLPLSKIGNILTLAVGNPFDILKLDDVRTLTTCDLRPVVSSERAIRKAIHNAYNPDAAQMEMLLDDLKEQNADTRVDLKKDSEEEQIDLSALADDNGESRLVK